MGLALFLSGGGGASEGGREVNRKVVGSRCPGVSHGAGGVGGDSSCQPSLTAQPGPVGTRQGTGQRSGCLGVGGCVYGRMLRLAVFVSVVNSNHMSLAGLHPISWKW